MIAGFRPGGRARVHSAASQAIAGARQVLELPNRNGVRGLAINRFREMITEAEAKPRAVIGFRELTPRNLPLTAADAGKIDAHVGRLIQAVSDRMVDPTKNGSLHPDLKAKLVADAEPDLRVALFRALLKEASEPGVKPGRIKNLLYAATGVHMLFPRDRRWPLKTSMARTVLFEEDVVGLMNAFRTRAITSNIPGGHLTAVIDYATGVKQQIKRQK